MDAWRRLPRWFRRTVGQVLGWLLVLGGIAALVLPGPGLLMLLAGMILLSQEYEWARRGLKPVGIRANVTAAQGVQTWPRMLATATGGLALIAAGIVWAVNPTIPRFWIFGPKLPFAGLSVGLTLGLSGVVVFALLGYSVRHFRGRSVDDVRRETREHADADGR